MPNENPPQPHYGYNVKYETDPAQLVPAEISVKSYTFAPCGTSDSTTPVSSSSSDHSSDAPTTHTATPKAHDDLSINATASKRESEAMRLSQSMSVAGPHMMNYAGTGRIWNHDRAAKIRAEAIAIRKASAEQEARDNATVAATALPVRHDSMSPEDHFAGTNESTKNKEVGKKPWFKRLFSGRPKSTQA